MSKHLGRSMVLITAFTLLQKALGFVREMVMAHFYGTSAVVDAVSMSNSAAEIFMGFTTAFGLIFLPLYSRIAAEEGRTEGTRFMNQMLTLVACFGAALGVFVMLFAGPIISFVAPGFSGTAYTYSVLFLRLTVWGILLQSLSAVFLNFLNYQEAYLLSTTAGLVVSPVQMLVILGSVRLGEVYVGAMMLLSNLLYAAVLYALCRRFAFRLSPRLRPVRRFRPVFKMVLPIFAGNAIAYMNLTVDKIFGSQLETGSVAALDYAFNIRTLLVTVFTVAITTIVYPMLSKASAEGEEEKLRQVTARGFDLITMLFLPLTVAVMLLARPLLTLFYGGGVFDETSIRLTSGALVFYSAGLWGVAMREYLTRVYYSIQKTKALVFVWLTTMAVNISGDFLLVPRFGVDGLAFATSLSVLAASFVLYLPLRRHLHGLYSRDSLSVFVRALAAAAVMGLVVYWSRQVFLPMLGTRKPLLLAYLLGIAAVGSSIYFALLLLFRVKGASELVQSVLRRQG